jgi:4-amino-4-deoxy-L-arabinose transferase-like glycosyltransferase
MPTSRPAAWPINRQDAWVLAPVLLGLVLRVAFLGSIPLGLHPDEVTTADFTIRHLFLDTGETFYALRPGPYAQPTLYYYLIYLSLQLFGRTFFALRILSVIAGTLAILFTYAIVAHWNDRRTALITAILLSGFHYHLHWSRLALNNVWDTLWIPLTLAAFLMGWRSRWSGGAVISGLALGFSQYFYVGSRVAIFILPFLIFKLWGEEKDPRRLVIHVGKMTAIAVVACLPLLIYAGANASLFFSRATINWTLPTMTAEQYHHGLASALLMLVRQAWNSFAGFISLSDYSAFYQPGVPFLIGLSSLFFLAGIFLAIYRRNSLLLLWLAITIFFGSFLVPGPPDTSHMIPAVPAMVWLVALPLAEMDRSGYKRLASILLLLILITDLYFYFGIYIPGGGDPESMLPFPPLP